MHDALIGLFLVSGIMFLTINTETSEAAATSIV